MNATYQFGPYLLDADEGYDGPIRYWRARRIFDSGMERPCRVRLVDLRHIGDAEARDALMQEARLLIDLKHPGIVATQDYGILGETMYLENERIEGMGLDALLDRFGRLDQGVALTILCRLAEILTYAHKATDAAGSSLHLVHRNLLPRHVFITPHGETKLSGFGMAQFRGRLTGTTLREAYAQIGCLNPEEARNERADYRSDLFGLGTLLFRMLTGRDPFHSPNYEEMRSQILAGSYPSPYSLRPELDRRVGELLSNLLQVDPRHRPPSAWAVWKGSWKLWREIGSPDDEVRLRDLVLTQSPRSGETAATLEDNTTQG